MAKSKKAANAKRYSNKQPLNKYPPLIRELLKKFDNNMLAASRAVGHGSGWWIGKFGHGRPLDDASKEIVEKALRGEAVPIHSVGSRGGDMTKRAAIVIVKSDQFERLYDVAITMGGEWKLKKKAGGFWIGIVEMGNRDLTAYLALATAKGVESYTT